MNTVFVFIAQIMILQVIIVLCYILMAAFLTLFERQILAAVQRRRGPNVVGPLGLFQAFADAFKLLFKEQTLPIASAKIVFLSASIYIVSLSLFIWGAIPMGYGSVIAKLDNYALLYFLSISGAGIYGLIVAGWSSNSRYPFLGSMRACAQLLAYELVMAFVIMFIFLITRDLSFAKIIELQGGAAGMHWFFFDYILLFPIWMLCVLAETNRAPFDLAEAESELVSGFNVEYPGMPFAFLFLGEYLHVIVMSNLTVIMWFGGWENFGLIPAAILYAVKLICIIFVFIWIRATMPRFRYDQLMNTCWKILLPSTFAVFPLILSILFLSSSTGYYV